MRNIFKRYVKAGYALVSIAFLCVACAQEEQETSLLVGNKCPMTFAVEQSPFLLPQDDGMPQTRVVDRNDEASVKSAWSDGDKIQVFVTSMTTDKASSTTCTLDANGKITHYAPILYWQAAGKHAIQAWYSNVKDACTTDASDAVDISDQTKRLAYAMKAEPTTYVYHLKNQGAIPLVFHHQLAKVRVRLQSSNAIDLLKTSVRVRNCFTSCTVDKGIVIPSGNANGMVKMMSPTTADGYFEANVIPDAEGMPRSVYAFEVTVNGSKPIIAAMDKPVSFEAGKAYQVSITVN